MTTPAARHPGTPATRLIVNADDFGLTEGINRAIGELSHAGAITSATLMASGPAFDHAVAAAAHLPDLGVGCHVVLVDGLCVSNPKDIPTLANPAGQFRSSLGGFVAAVLMGRINASHIHAEAVAQIRKLQNAGIAVTHIDTHKHTHIFPAVRQAVLRAACECGVPAIRNPYEPAWSARQSDGSTLRRTQLALVRPLAQTFAPNATRAGLRTTDGTLGIAATGTVDAQSLRHLLRKIPPGTWEIICHPGVSDAQLQGSNTRLLESRGVEQRALLEVMQDRTAVGHLQRIRYTAL